MATIQCPGCNAHLSVKGLVNCPLCQTYLNPPHHRTITPATHGTRPVHLDAQTAPRLSTTFGWAEWLGAATLAGIAAMVVVLIYTATFPSAEKIRDRQVSAALAQCQHAIRAHAQYGEAETPPYVPNHGRDDEFHFAWAPGAFHFTNGFGAKVRMSASCNGNVSSGKIQSLTLTGKDLL
jgi:hypothetical protein